MENNQYKQKDQRSQRDDRREYHKSQHSEVCSGGRECPHCHKAINDTCELCPYCGRPIRDDYCIFCGTPYEGDEPFCGECGSPRGGIKCPQCGALSFRSFCSHCNAPLNDNAMEAIKQAQADPKFQRAQRLTNEMASMEAYLNAFKEEIEKAIAEAEMEPSGPDAPGLSKEGEELQAKYAELLKLIGNVPAPQPQQKTVEKPSVKRRQQLKIKFADADRIMEAYKAKAAEMQAVLRDMIPDANMTPAMQRDYACARKVATVTSRQEKVPQYWICNFCGCTHNQPSECAEPKLGGTWIYQTVTVSEKVWHYMD